MSKLFRTVNAGKTDARLKEKLYVDDLCGEI